MPKPQPQNLTHTRIDSIIDAYLRDNNVYFVLEDGRILVYQATNDILELYWEVKLRNRRRAFGLA